MDSERRMFPMFLFKMSLGSSVPGESNGRGELGSRWTTKNRKPVKILQDSQSCDSFSVGPFLVFLLFRGDVAKSLRRT